MKNLKSIHTVLSIVVALACVYLSASAQTADDRSKIASASATGDGVRFEVAVPYSAVTMTVSAPNGKVFRKEFQTGSSPVFKLIDKRGNRLPDGQYVYELRLTPILSVDMKKELAATRDKDDDAADEVEGRVRGALPAHPLVQSGAFSVQRGVVVVPGAVEAEGQRSGGRVGKVHRGSTSADTYVQPGASTIQQAAFLLEALASRPSSRMFAAGIPHPAFPDQVIPDDLIVQGSICVGLDCVNNENFGFDTIRLKENNTRIQFDDTSVGAFPTNNWQIRANSSASGGESFLGFVDQGASGNSETGTVVFSVAAGAPANSIKVDSGGRLGLRTATPVLDIHANTSNTPAIRLEQNSSGGFTAQTWDVAGNEANFFVRDVTGGSRLPFRIRPGAPTSSIDIAADGDVGIGTASPDQRLHVVKSASAANAFLGYFQNSAGNGSAFIEFQGGAAGTTSQMGAASTGDFVISTGATEGTFSNERLRIMQAGNVGIGTTAPDQRLTVNGEASKPSGGTWLVFSDERLKAIKRPFTSGLKAVMQLQPLFYEYTRNNALGIRSEGEHIGFGAQAVQKIIPEAVTRNTQGYLLINNDPILWTMLNAIKEQQKEIEELKAQVRKLQTASRRRR